MLCDAKGIIDAVVCPDTPAAITNTRRAGHDPPRNKITSAPGTMVAQGTPPIGDQTHAPPPGIKQRMKTEPLN